jgi:DNA-binding XRE family transcriptional regulator
MDTLQEHVDVIRAARVLVGMSQADLASACGLSRQIIVRMENHKGNVTVAALSAARSVLEQAGVVFIPSTSSRGPGIALVRRAD